MMNLTQLDELMTTTPDVHAPLESIVLSLTMNAKKGSRYRHSDKLALPDGTTVRASTDGYVVERGGVTQTVTTAQEAARVASVTSTALVPVGSAVTLREAVGRRRERVSAGGVYQMGALELLRALPDGSVDLIATDPPYNVGKASWDSWPTNADFLAWLDGILREMRRVLKANGSLYLFCDTSLGADVEIAVRKHFNALLNIRWKKPPFSTKAEMFDKATMRNYFPASETIIFAEQYGADKPYADALIDGNSTYWEACEVAKIGVIGDYLLSEFNRAGATRREIAALFPSRTGGLTGCVSNWLLGLNVPTPEQYQTMRDYLNRSGSYDYLRREYEDLRREYEDLRRPFYAEENRPYTDVWDYATVNTYPGKHPCEKPYDMLRDIVLTSSREGDTVLDCFCGSGVTLRAARDNGRKWIGGDFDSYWADRARESLRAPFEPRATKRESSLTDLPLFAPPAA